MGKIKKATFKLTNFKKKKVMTKRTVNWLWFYICGFKSRNNLKK